MRRIVLSTCSERTGYADGRTENCRNVLPSTEEQNCLRSAAFLCSISVRLATNCVTVNDCGDGSTRRVWNGQEYAFEPTQRTKNRPYVLRGQMRTCKITSCCMRMRRRRRSMRLRICLPVRLTPFPFPLCEKHASLSIMPCIMRQLMRHGSDAPDTSHRCDTTSSEYSLSLSLCVCACVQCEHLVCRRRTHHIAHVLW